MAVVAYTSAAVNPVASQADAVLAQAALPVAAVPLYGGGVDSLDNTPHFTFAWQIIENPLNSTAVFQDTGTVNSTLQNPTIINVNQWGNIRAFLVVTNTDDATSSEADIYKAPDTAFVQVRVTSTTLGVQKPAPGERNWMAPYNAMVAAIDSFATSVGNAALPAAVLQLISGGYAWFNNAQLHLHKGIDVDVAQAPLAGGAPGVVKLTDAPVDASNPKALNAENLVYTANLGGTPTAAGYSPGTVEPPVVLVGTVRAHALFWVKEACTVDTYQICLSDGGSVAGGPYRFALYQGTKADWESGAPAIVGTAVTGTAAGDNRPLVLEKTGLNAAIAAGKYIGIVCTQAPTVPGGSAVVTVTAKRSV